MSIVPKGSSIPCCVDVGPSFEAGARYALHMLLVPLYLEPEWVDASDTERGIYYGRRPPETAGLALSASREAPAYFSTLEPYDAQRAVWFDGPEGSVPALFTSEDGDPDLVASAFLWLSGWQEHVTAQRDEHGRIPYSTSLSARLDVACRPVVDAYRSELAMRLRRAGIEVGRRKWAGRDWALCPTHDVDYLRKWRPGILYREFLQNLVFNRRKVGLGARLRRAASALQQIRSEDPYRAALRWMPDEVSRRGGTATYFVKAGGDDPHDVPYSLNAPFFRERCEDLERRGFEIAAHPSYRTPTDQKKLEEEVARLEQALGRKVSSVRHHYLRFDPRRTPQIHDALSFDIDSTLGFAEHEGFRRGTCLPFQLFDLENDRPLSTWEMPLAAMDSALFNRRELDMHGARQVTETLISACRRYGGALVALWHNTLGDELECAGWKHHFEHTLDTSAFHGAAIVSLSDALSSWT